MRAFFPATTGAAALLALASMSGADAASSYTYRFTSATAGGVAGTIKVNYTDSATPSKATITADLDFTDVKADALKTAEPLCTALPTEYAYSTHVLWPTATDAATSAAYDKCANDKAGGRLDPLNACSAESENIATDACKGKTYACTPAEYTKATTVREKGDLSGKNGNLKPDATSKKATVTWTDSSFPALSDVKPTWNIVLQAVCGTATPRVACAVGKLDAVATTTDTTATTNSNSTTNSTGTTNSTTPAPTTSAAGNSGVFNGVVVATSLLALLATLL